MNIARTICLGFAATIAIGAVLLTLPIATDSGEWNNPLIALFTSTSAVCVTGLAVVDTGSYFSKLGQAIVLLLIQIGGLGYMTTNTLLILIVGRRFNLNQKFALKEAFDRPFLQGSKNLVRSIIVTTVLFELLGTVLLMVLFADREDRLWLSLFHSVSAWNNAGFSLFPNSLVDYQSSLFANLVFSGLIVLGGLGYQAIAELYSWFVYLVQGNRTRFFLSLNFKVVVSTTLFLLLLGAVSFFLTDLASSLPFPKSLLAAWFQSVTTRTAGFNTIDIASMSEAALFITIGLMFVGASPSGTGGGIKTTTLRILLNSTRSILQGKDEVILYERTVPNVLILKAIAVLCGSSILVVAAVICLSQTDPQFTFIELFFEIVSAFATVGLSTGITAEISILGQLILILMMFVGRVGVLIFMNAILGEPRPSTIQYPEEGLLVG